MSFKIVSDSAANVFSLPEIDYAFVPLKIVCGDQEFVDEPTLDVNAMVDFLKSTKQKSSTSCPNAHDWQQAFSDAENVFAVCITSALSGSYSAAALGKEESLLAEPQKNICVIDTLSAGPEMRLIIEKISELIQIQKEFEQIQEAVQEYLTHTHLVFSLRSLHNLARNGRVHPTVAKLSGLLGIRIIGKASAEGTLEPLHKCKGTNKTLSLMFSEMQQAGYRGGKVRIAHCQNKEEALVLKELILKSFPDADIQIESCTALCSYYAESGGILVGYEDLPAAK